MAAVLLTTSCDTRPTLPRPRLVVVPTAAVYRRRRLAVAAVLLTVIVLAVVVVGRVATVLGGGPASVLEHRPGMQTYLVERGDTLWSIAARLQPDNDVRPLV